MQSKPTVPETGIRANYSDQKGRLQQKILFFEMFHSIILFCFIIAPWL
jgi:hypothetical protein